MRSGCSSSPRSPRKSWCAAIRCARSPRPRDRAWALAITSIGFAALHLANPSITPVALVNLAAAGLFLGVLALRTGSLWWCAGAHLGWNWALGFLFDLPVSGIETVD